MDEEIIDLQDVLERVENDRELLVELIEIFLEDYPTRMASLKKAVSEKNIASVKDAAHSLKGASANISAKKISAIFLGIEGMVKANDLSPIAESYAKLDLYIEELKKYLLKLKQDLKSSR